MGPTGSAQGGARERLVVTEAERRVADLLAIEIDPVLARATVETVPFWFHTFALNRAEGIYTPGAARDHRYRVCALPEDFAGMSVLDVGCFDGFYAFLAERRGAERVVAWTTSSVGFGLHPGGALSWRAGRASVPSMACSARRLSTVGWTRSRSMGSRSALISCTASGSCTGSRTHSGCCACCVGGRRAAARCCSRPTASARTIEARVPQLVGIRGQVSGCIARVHGVSRSARTE
jgi:hypothetical protein